MINRDLELDYKPSEKKDNIKSEKSSATIRTKIADIIQKNPTEHNQSEHQQSEHQHSNRQQSEHQQDSNHRKHFTKPVETDEQKKDFDKKVEKLVRELNDTNSETSLNYNPESNYHEVFSNSNEVINSISSASGLKLKSPDAKQKMFNKYLKI